MLHYYIKITCNRKIRNWRTVLKYSLEPQCESASENQHPEI